MAHIPQCDRCRTVGKQVVSVLGRDLCNRCVSEFDSWVKNGIRLGDKGHAGQGERRRQALEIVAHHGHVTSALLAAHSGLPRHSANWYLHRIAKAGHIKFVGEGRFEAVDIAPLSGT